MVRIKHDQGSLLGGAMKKKDRSKTCEGKPGKKTTRQKNHLAKVSGKVKVRQVAKSNDGGRLVAHLFQSIQSQN